MTLIVTHTCDPVRTRARPRKAEVLEGITGYHVEDKYKDEKAYDDKHE